MWDVTALPQGAGGPRPYRRGEATAGPSAIRMLGAQPGVKLFTIAHLPVTSLTATACR